MTTTDPTAEQERLLQLAARYQMTANAAVEPHGIGQPGDESADRWLALAQLTAAAAGSTRMGQPVDLAADRLALALAAMDDDERADPTAAPQPATPGETRKRVQDAKRHLFARIIASAHLLDTPFTNAPDESPWTRLKPAMGALTAALDELDAAPAAVGVDLPGIRAHAAALDADGLRRFVDALAADLVRTRRMLAEERDAAPAADPVYRLPDNPDGPLRDRHGHRWQRVGAVSWGRTDELNDPHWRSWSWPDLLAARGPLSTTPPAGTEGERDA